MIVAEASCVTKRGVTAESRHRERDQQHGERSRELEYPGDPRGLRFGVSGPATGGVETLNCSNCRSRVAPDAGFCRSCGAILRGKGASATLIPSAPVSGPAPPASGPEPPLPLLATAGYWAPPQAVPWPGAQDGRASERPSVHLGPAHERGKPYAQPGGVSHLPGGPHTLPTWSGGAPSGGAAIVKASLRRQRRLQAMDLAALFGAVAVLGSLFMPWYQLAYNVRGLSLSRSLTALSEYSGGWRWLMLACSLAVAAELLATLWFFRANTMNNWPHRSLLALLCGANLALVTIATMLSPFGVTDGLDLFHASLAAGSYVGVVGAVVGVGAAGCRLVTGPPALVR
jgi:hypothetical protein